MDISLKNKIDWTSNISFPLLRSFSTGYSSGYFIFENNSESIIIILVLTYRVSEHKSLKFIQVQSKSGRNLINTLNLINDSVNKVNNSPYIERKSHHPYFLTSKSQ